MQYCRVFLDTLVMGLPYDFQLAIRVCDQGSTDWYATLTGAFLGLFNRYLETVNVVERWHGRFESASGG